MPLIEIFETGKHTDSAGQEKEWTESDIDTIVEKYNKQKDHQAPIVIGHPQSDSPAYGWVEGLKREGNKLLAEVKPTVQEFVDWVKQGLYKKVSIALYPDMLLRHIGFLGGTPPAVKGLKAPEFASSEFSEWIEFRQWTKEERDALKKGAIKGDFAGPNETYPIASPADVADAWQLSGQSKNPDQIKVKIIEIAKRFGWIDALPPTAIEWAKARKIAFKEVTNMDQDVELKETKQKLAEKEKELQQFAEVSKKKDDELSALKSQLELKEKEARLKNFSDNCDTLLKEGKLVPVQKQMIIEFMEIIHNTQEWEFSEGEKKVKANPLDKFNEFLKSLPKQVDLSEKATKENCHNKEKEITLEYGKYDESRMELHKKALQYCEKHPNTTYAVAVEIVSKEV